jgi:hypothetical protein
MGESEDYTPTMAEITRYVAHPYEERIKLLDQAIALVKMGVVKHLDQAIAAVAAGA